MGEHLDFINLAPERGGSGGGDDKDNGSTLRGISKTTQSLAMERQGCP